jgi:hypothetical protein
MVTSRQFCRHQGVLPASIQLVATDRRKSVGVAPRSWWKRSRLGSDRPDTTFAAKPVSLNLAMVQRVLRQHPRASR